MAEATAVGGELLPVIRFNNLRHAALASLYLGLSFTWLPHPLVVLPSEVREFYPNDFNSYIGYATGIGAIFATTVPPIVGAWSDRVTTWFGRRRPFMVAGVLLGIVGLMVMMTAHSYTQFVVGHVIAQLFLNGAAAAYYAIIPDIVPDAEFGKASGFLAGMQQGGALLGIELTAAMIVPGIWGGSASDRHGRKRFVYAAGAMQITVALYFIAFYPTQQGIVLGLGALYGIGYGLYLAVDWALACDTIPDRAKAAKDMGLFHVAQTLPNSIIPAIEGGLIDHFNKHVAVNSGYRVAFGSVILFFLLGTIFVSRIRSVR